VSKVTKGPHHGWIAGLLFVTVRRIDRGGERCRGHRRRTRCTRGSPSQPPRSRGRVLDVPGGVLIRRFSGCFPKKVPSAPSHSCRLRRSWLSRYMHPMRPRAWARAALPACDHERIRLRTVERRRRLFPAPLASPRFSAAANPTRRFGCQPSRRSCVGTRTPILLRDPVEQSMVDAHRFYRIAAGLRVYARVCFKIIFPSTLSGDYSAPQSPFPPASSFRRLVGPLGGVPAFCGPAWASWRAAAPQKWQMSGYFPPSTSPSSWGKSPGFRDLGRRIVWIWWSYSHSPTFRFCSRRAAPSALTLFPRAGNEHRGSRHSSSRMVAAFSEPPQRSRHGVVLVVFVGFQAVARAPTPTTTPTIWFLGPPRATRSAAAEAHLNVHPSCQGARAHLEERRPPTPWHSTWHPEWPMANVYLGDTLVRMHRPDEGWPYYNANSSLPPTIKYLVALPCQCLWGRKKTPERDHGRRSWR